MLCGTKDSIMISIQTKLVCIIGRTRAGGRRLREGGLFNLDSCISVMNRSEATNNSKIVDKKI